MAFEVGTSGDALDVRGADVGSGDLYIVDSALYVRDRHGRDEMMISEIASLACEAGCAEVVITA